MRRSARHLVAIACVGMMPFAVLPARAADLTGFGVIATIAGGDASFDFATTDPVARRLYVARGNGVMSVDLDTLVATPVLVPGNDVHIALPLPNGRLLSTNGGFAMATLADARTGEVISVIPTGDDPDGAAFDPATGLVFIVDGDGGFLTMIDPRTATAIGKIELGGDLEFAVADGTGHLFVVMKSKAAVAVVDTVARRVAAVYPLPGCIAPNGIGIDAETNILVTACANQTALALDARTGTVVATLPIDRIPDAVIFDAQQRMFFIPCARDGTLIAIAEADGALKVVEKIKTAIGAHTGALDPKTGRLYLPAADFSASSSGFEQQPGTFRILVIGEK